MNPSRYLILFIGAVLAVTADTAVRAQPADRKKVLKRFAEEFVELTPGKGKFPASFDMGSSSDAAPASEKPVVKVTFARPFAMAKYEVTQELYEVVMGKNPSRWPGPRNSVERVNWDEANTFCKKVTELLRQHKLIGASDVIRLPSEAEWEYACRAGTKTAYSFGDRAADLGAYAWFDGNSKGENPPVGKKKPNAWGLYDMHGYVWEWCADAWGPTHKGASTTGAARIDKDEKDRVTRGGSWADPPDSARSRYRDHKPLTYRSDRVGFRCVRVAGNKGGGK
jgi:formylglycine-generating enzyme required for sulfatase activity